LLFFLQNQAFLNIEVVDNADAAFHQVGKGLGVAGVAQHVLGFEQLCDHLLQGRTADAMAQVADAGAPLEYQPFRFLVVVNALAAQIVGKGIGALWCIQ